MANAEIQFGDGREGVVPLGTYLGDAAKRMGVPKSDCEDPIHECEFVIEKGIELFSDVTEAEKEHLADGSRKDNIRLGCFAQIQKPGVIVAMTKKETEKTNEPNAADDRDQSYRKDFTELPLEKKIANLVQLEAITISETLAYVINSPFTVFDKIGDVLAEFGHKKEEAEKQRAHPADKASNTKRTQAKRSAKKQPDAEA